MSLPIAPTAEPERMAALDALRGFAVLGILVMNVQSFSMPFSAYVNPTVWAELWFLESLRERVDMVYVMRSSC